MKNATKALFRTRWMQLSVRYEIVPTQSPNKILPKV